jgi:hypothetical protein
MFQTFWELYPRKVSRKTAEKAFNRLSRSEQEEALKALPNHIKYWQLKDTEKEFIPHATTWINQARYQDEIDLAPTVAKKPQIPWYSNDELTLAKGRELGINPHPGETMGQYRSRIQASMHSQATNSVAQNMGTNYLSQIYNKNKV